MHKSASVYGTARQTYSFHFQVNCCIIADYCKSCKSFHRSASFQNLLYVMLSRDKIGVNRYFNILYKFTKPNVFFCTELYIFYPSYLSFSFSNAFFSIRDTYEREMFSLSATSRWVRGLMPYRPYRWRIISFSRSSRHSSIKP